jgi:plastocyanin
MACTGLTTSKANPSIGDTVTFTCAGNVVPAGTAVTYRFRYSTNGGTTWTGLTNATATTASMTITACGTYSVQCQACATLNGKLTCDPFWVGVQ